MAGLPARRSFRRQGQGTHEPGVWSSGTGVDGVPGWIGGRTRRAWEERRREKMTRAVSTSFHNSIRSLVLEVRTEMWMQCECRGASGGWSVRPSFCGASPHYAHCVVSVSLRDGRRNVRCEPLSTSRHRTGEQLDHCAGMDRRPPELKLTSSRLSQLTSPRLSGWSKQQCSREKRHLGAILGRHATAPIRLEYGE